MSHPRFFATDSPTPADDAAIDGRPWELPLDAGDVHHAVRVLRLKAGDEVDVAGPGRRIMRVSLTSVTPDALSGTVLGPVPAPFEPRVTLVQGLAKSDKLDLVVEKAVELGVERVVPVAFERSVVRLDAARARARAERLRRVAVAAAKQSGRSFVPSVDEPVDASGLGDALAGSDIVLLAWEEAAGSAPGVGEALASASATPESSVAIVVGPEGGLTAAEAGRLLGEGALTVSLGDTVLRTETAGILSVALCVYELGGLGGRSRG